MDATVSRPTAQGAAGTGWLLGFCVARALFSTITTSYAAALPLLKQDWAMSAQESGLISSAYNFGFLISLFVVGFAADRYGAKRTYLVSSTVAAVSALAFAFYAHDFLSAFVLFGLSGLFSGGSYTPGLAILAQRFHSRGRGRAIGFYIAASSAGYAASLLLSGAMISLSGWRAAFIVTCSGPLLGMLVGAWVLWNMPNVIPPPSPERPDENMLQAVVTNKAGMIMILGYTFHSWELLGLWAWMTFYLSTVISGGAATVSGASLGAAFTAVGYLISVGGPVTGGMLSDRFGRTAVIAVVSSVSMLCAFAIGWLALAPLWVVVAVLFLYQFTGIADSPILSTAQTELVSPRYIGAAYSVRSVLGWGAGAISPWVFGLVLDWGRGTAEVGGPFAFGMAFSALGLGGLLCPLLMIWLRTLPDARKMAGGKR